MGRYPDIRKASEEFVVNRQKSSRLSRCVRFVIARHSPERVLEKGLPMEAPEKNRCNRSEPAQGQIFSGPVGRGNTAKSRPFPHISRAIEQNFSAVETAWRRGRDSNPRYPSRYGRFRGGSFQPLTHLSARGCHWPELPGSLSLAKEGETVPAIYVSSLPASPDARPSRCIPP